MENKEKDSVDAKLVEFELTLAVLESCLARSGLILRSDYSDLADRLSKAAELYRSDQMVRFGLSELSGEEIASHLDGIAARRRATADRSAGTTAAN